MSMMREQFTFRSLNSEDKDRAKELHDMCLPVKYDAKFYNAATSPSSKLFSSVCLCGSVIVGIAISRIENQLSASESGLVELSPKGRELLYIMTLVVDPNYERRGIGSMLLDHLFTLVPFTVKAVYLHVLDSNIGALHFYEKNRFKRKKKLYQFYYIDNKCRDAYLYVLYINDGKPPNTWTPCIPIVYFFAEYCPFVLSVSRALFDMPGLCGDRKSDNL